MNKKLSAYLAGACCMGMSLTVQAAFIPVASDWSTSISTVFLKGSGASNTSISNIIDGVQLHYDAPSGGRGVGTDRRQYDFTTTATGSFDLTFDIEFTALTGFFFNELSLGIVQNNSLVNTLIPFTTRAPSNVNRTFNGIQMNLNAGDTWGVRVQAGNFTACCGVSGDIMLTNFTSTRVPEPSTGALTLLGIVLFALLRWQRLFVFKTTKLVE